SLLKESRRSEATVEAPAPGHAKPSSGTTHREEPATVEEFQISEEPRTVAPDDVPAMAAFDITREAPAIPLAPEADIAAETEVPEKVPRTSEPEFELEQEYELVLDAEPLVPAYDQKPPEKPIFPSEPATVAQNAAPPAGSGDRKSTRLNSSHT